jgi:predicted helicase
MGRRHPEPRSSPQLGEDGGAERPFAVFPTTVIPDLNCFGPGTVPQWYSLYTYDEEGGSRRDNVTEWAVKKFREHYKDEAITRRHIFCYVYAILHHTGYRERYQTNLRSEGPRIPLVAPFKQCLEIGEQLIRLHLEYDRREPFELGWEEEPKVPLSYRVKDAMKLSKDRARLKVKESLTLTGIPAGRSRINSRTEALWSG